MSLATKSSAVLIHGLCAIAISAERAANFVRQQIPDWNPALIAGFQGRQLIVLMDYTEMKQGRCVGDRKQLVYAIGNDGQVRDVFRLLNLGVECGTMCIVDASKPASLAQYEALVDQALATAMPSSYLVDIEASFDFLLKRPEAPQPWDTRLKMYTDAGIAPELSDESSLSEDDRWSVNFSLFACERLFAMCELYSVELGAVLDVHPTHKGGPNLDFLITAYGHWYREQFTRRAA